MRNNKVGRIENIGNMFFIWSIAPNYLKIGIYGMTDKLQSTFEYRESNFITRFLEFIDSIREIISLINLITLGFKGLRQIKKDWRKIRPPKQRPPVKFEETIEVRESFQIVLTRPDGTIETRSG
ncbi:MAG: hypothetical protein OXC62_05980 [Aestuariivita sp.]|nr:hypothetical protein [Aestuariivita sp.]